jgi:tetratricopeptide (TPR) repeat protein
LQPGNAYVLVRRGGVYSQGKLPDKALNDFDSALAVDSRNVEALVNRAALHSVGGNPRKAIDDLDKALEIWPANAMALYNRGFARFVVQDYEQAMADYTLALKQEPSFAPAYNNRCLSAAMLGRDRSVTMKDCDEAIARAPERADLRETRGLVHLKYGEFAAAIADYDGSLILDGKRPLALFGRGVARQHMGEAAKAKTDFELAHALKPDVESDFVVFGVKR